jgi:hypothetical protein
MFKCTLLCVSKFKQNSKSLITTEITGDFGDWEKRDVLSNTNKSQNFHGKIGDKTKRFFLFNRHP